MLSARHRFPSRGAMAARTAVGGRAEGPMVTQPPPEKPTGMFRGSPLPIQNLVAAGVRELRVSMLDAATAIRLGGNSARPRYFGTTVAPPTEQWLAPADVTGEDQVRAGVINGGNAPQMLNKTTAEGGGEAEPEAPRIARSLPQRRM